MASPVGNGHDFNKFLDLDDDHRHLARELAAAFLHTVFFCRSLGPSLVVSVALVALVVLVDETMMR